MKRQTILCLAVAIALACFAPKTLAIEGSELTAIQGLFTAFQTPLAAIGWNFDSSNLCVGTVWQGISCESGHITALTLPTVPLNGPLPSIISGLNYARTINLANCGLTGTIPSVFTTMTNITSLQLNNNKFQLCGADPLVMSTSCDVTGQNLAFCGSNCCGCRNTWLNSGTLCQYSIPDCGTCSGATPPEYPNATCSDGFYVIPESFTGGLTVNGRVAISGDYTLPLGETLAIVGFSSTLNVTGKVTMRSFGIVIAATEADTQLLKSFGRFNVFRVTYMYVGNPIRTPGTFNGGNSLVAVHTRRACQKPITTSVGDSTTWTVSMRNVNSCNTWWIILICLLPAIIGGLLGGILPFCCK